MPTCMYCDEEYVTGHSCEETVDVEPVEETIEDEEE